MRPALAGLVAGMAAAAILSRYVESLLFEVEPLDPLTYALCALALALAAAVACAIPAAWAARVDPMESLSAE